jgi:hypothetical protein
MREPPRGASFLQKPLAVFLLGRRFLSRERNRFNGDDAVDFRIQRSIHHSHSATTDLGLDLVTTEGLLARDFHV